MQSVSRDVRRSLVLCWCLACVSSVCVSGAADAVSVQGDWQGTWSTAAGERTLAAQVIALGKGSFRCNVLGRFDTREPALAVWEGREAGDAVRFGEHGTIAGGVFRGTLAVDGGGVFSLQRVERPSPTLGAAPPADGVVLFDGSDFEAWHNPTHVPGICNLRRIRTLAGDNRVAYLRARLWMAQGGAGRLDLGSDDGVKVWLNGSVVHANNVARPCTPNQDQVAVTFRDGWNELLVKVVQGGGDWAACVRVLGADGSPSAGARLDSVSGQESGLADGYILQWQVAGPYRREGVGAKELFDHPFPPEQGADVSWMTVRVASPEDPYRWRLTEDGAMEIRPRGGSMMTKAFFQDVRVHVEFRTPFMPTARGQGRGNSGVYLQGRYEVQILDSYGLEGRDNECGGVYKVSAPRVNMCAPPLQWQTYDIDFRAPRFDADGKKTEHARLTVRHNGVLIHEDLEVPKPTGGGRGDLSTPGPLLLQDHNNPVRFRNIWVAPLP